MAQYDRIWIISIIGILFNAIVSRGQIIYVLYQFRSRCFSRLCDVVIAEKFHFYKELLYDAIHELGHRFLALRSHLRRICSRQVLKQGCREVLNEKFGKVLTMVINLNLIEIPKNLLYRSTK